LIRRPGPFAQLALGHFDVLFQFSEMFTLWRTVDTLAQDFDLLQQFVKHGGVRRFLGLRRASTEEREKGDEDGESDCLVHGSSPRLTGPGNGALNSIHSIRSHVLPCDARAENIASDAQHPRTHYRSIVP
jgi:hypothetical protein